ncbi:MAG: hypothetical protein ACK5L0_00865 [Candidatus Fimivivens sp.]
MMKKTRKSKILVYTAITVVLMLYVFSNASNLNPMYSDGAFFWCIAISAYTLAWCVLKLGSAFLRLDANTPGRVPINIDSINFKSFPKAAKLLLIVPWILFIGINIFSIPLFHYKAYRDQLGPASQQVFSSDMQAVDLTKVPIVDEELALKLADKKLGERASLGSQVVLGEPTIQMNNDRLIWAVPLHHSGIFKWLTNLSGTPGYIVVSATNTNDVKYVEGHKIKYQPRSYLLHDIGRYTRFTSALFDGITDYSFELDDTGTPHWIVSTYKNLRGFALPEATGVIIVNASTGETQKYDIANVPDWVDRVQPEYFIRNQIINQGEYVHGIFNFADKDKFQPSEGQAVVYNNGRCYLFTGLTSVGNDESAIGFMMVDMVTKKPLLYQMNGATEYAAQGSAQGKVQHLGYYASFPLIINVDSIPTYFMTLKDQERLIKQYAFVSVSNYSTVGVGETITQAYRNYQTALRQSNDSNQLLPSSGSEQKLTGTIERISSQYNGEDTVYFVILSDYTDKIYTINSSLSSELALTREGDRVQIAYWQNEGNAQPIVKATDFDNLQYTQK